MEYSAIVMFLVEQMKIEKITYKEVVMAKSELKEQIDACIKEKGLKINKKA